MLSTREAGKALLGSPSFEALPCGYHGDPKHACGCAPAQVERYRERISGPLLDRIDLHVEAPAVPFEDLRKQDLGEPSAAMRERVVVARDVQRVRLGSGKVRVNARMNSQQRND